MMELEINQVDLKHKDIRLSLPKKERALLVSIQENGFFENLSCIENKNAKPILIDGFKRFRCAQKLNIPKIPVTIISNNEVDGLLQVIRNHDSHTLTMIEQASIVDKLLSTHNLTNADVAKKVGRSQAWVSLRKNFIKTTSDSVKQCIFKGEFPLRSYLYSVKPFTRVKNVDKNKIDEFVNLTKNKDLSTRDIDLLAKSFFSGDSHVEAEIRNGNIDWTVKQLRELNADLTQSQKSKEKSELIKQNNVLKDVGFIYHLMSKLSYPSERPSLTKEERQLLRNMVVNIETQFPEFMTSIRRYCD